MTTSLSLYEVSSKKPASLATVTRPFDCNMICVPARGCRSSVSTTFPLIELWENDEIVINSIVDNVYVILMLISNFVCRLFFWLQI